MESQTAVYLKAKEGLENLKSEIEKTEDVIDDTFIFWYAEQYPEEFKKLQNWAIQKIRKIVYLKYIHDGGEWADAVIIKTGNGTEEDEWDVKTLVFNTSDYFNRQDYEGEFTYTDEWDRNDELKEIDDVVRGIYRNYPTNESEEL